MQRTWVCEKRVQSLCVSAVWACCWPADHELPVVELLAQQQLLGLPAASPSSQAVPHHDSVLLLARSSLSSVHVCSPCLASWSGRVCTVGHREAGPCAEAVAEVLGTSPSTFLSIRISLLNHSRMVPFLDMPDEIGSRRTSPLCYLRTASSGMHGRGGSTNVVYYDLIQTGTMRPKGAKICSSRPCCACTQSHIAPICCQTSVQPAAHTNSAHSAMLSCHGRSPAVGE